MGKETSGTAVTRLNLIENKHRSMLATGNFELLQEIVFGNEDAGDTLNTFHHHSRNITLCQFAYGSLHIVEGEKGHFMSGVEERLDRRVVGNGNRSGGAAVE